ncbi:hypothetical protein HUT03_01785 [Candidatus Liberibacter africanus]|uniref:Uncharacterized protein n=1 Tax=Candidatus Liberibacter africanus PTSAPSY TaxID=1277257 RepID=A0A0G3I8F0_LIBAF|nr:hypothetical protein [Candidatus Liberibacter africanus]AKK19997.1 hypothetical protein G293_01825 [Candidatus Liberibacter africanus PTSAPSY]QTP63828.1 hypothetical protein HUT03_01785 [Candidatus Liberibacter africanus]
MIFENQFLEDVLKHDRKEKKIKSLAQVLQGIAIHALLTNRTKNIKSITKGFIEYWIAYNSRCWRISQPRACFYIHIAYQERKKPVYICIGKTPKNATHKGKIYQ